jgi:hypothetical protein
MERFGIKLPNTGASGTEQFGIKLPEQTGTDTYQRPESGLRHIGRTAARVAEHGPGFFLGTIPSAALWSVDKVGQGLGWLTGKIAPGSHLSEKLKKSDTSAIRNYLPTPENIKYAISDNIERLIDFVTGSKKALSSQSVGEERADEFVSDIAPFLFSGGLGNVLKFVGEGGSLVDKAMRLGRAFGVPLGANVAKWLTEDITDSKELGSAVKLGTILTASLAGGRKQLTDIAKRMYGIATSNPDQVINIENNLHKAARGVLKEMGGIGSPSKDIVTKLGKDIINAAGSNKEMTIRDLIEADQVLNEYFGAYKDVLSKNKQAKYWLGQLKGGIEKAIGSTKTTHPEFYNSYTKAKDIWKGLNRTDSIKDFIESVASGEKLKSPFTAYLFFKNPKTVLYKGALMGAANIVKHPYNVLKSILVSKNARKHYYSMLKAASNSNGPIVIKELKRLDEELAKEEE